MLELKCHGTREYDHHDPERTNERKKPTGKIRNKLLAASNVEGAVLQLNWGGHHGKSSFN